MTLSLRHPLRHHLRHHLRPALLATAALLLPAWAKAHDGHGPSGAHWHATDTLGFVLLAVVFAAGVWWARRK